MTLRLLTLAAITAGLLSNPTIGAVGTDSQPIDPVGDHGIELVDLLDRHVTRIVTDESDVDWSVFAPVPPPIVPGGGGVSFRL